MYKVKLPAHIETDSLAVPGLVVHVHERDFDRVRARELNGTRFGPAVLGVRQEVVDALPCAEVSFNIVSPPSHLPPPPSSTLVFIPLRARARARQTDSAARSRKSGERSDWGCKNMQINTQQRIQRKDAFVLSLHYANNKKIYICFQNIFYK